MATVYIIYSKQIDRFYIGSCKNIEDRLMQHRSNFFPKSFTSKASDWELFYTIEGVEYTQARNIEAHIKRMKSRKYLENLKQYPDMTKKIILKYEGSFR